MEITPRRVGWQQLTQGKRDRMQVMLRKGEIQKDIAEVLKVAPSTVSRERKRETEDGIYDAEVAQRKAYVERLNSKYQGMKVEKNIPLKEHVIRQLRQKRSPDEIAGRMKRDKLDFYASKKPSTNGSTRSMALRIASISAPNGSGRGGKRKRRLG